MYVTSYMDVWIEIIRFADHNRPAVGHILYGCVDWNVKYLELINWRRRHILYGCVDWNIETMNDYESSEVTSYMDVWIEI